MSTSPDLEYLAAQLAFYTAAVELRAAEGGHLDEERLHGIVVRLDEAREQLATVQPGPAVSSLVERLALTPTELHVVWLLATLAVSNKARAHFTRFVAHSPEPTLAEIQALVFGSTPSLAAIEELGACGRLRRLGIIERSDGTAEVHDSRWTWVLSTRVLALLHGELDRAQALERLSISRVSRSACDLAVSEKSLEEVRRAVAGERGLVLLSGPTSAGRRSVLAAVAVEHGLRPLVIDAARMSKDRPALIAELRAIAFESKLQQRVPLIANLDALVEERDEQRLQLLTTELLEQVDGIVLATCGATRPAIRVDRPLVVLELERPSSEQVSKLWLRALGQGTEGDGEVLATRYPLAPGLIHRAAEAAKARVGDGRLTPDDIAAGIRTVLDDRLGQYARRVSVTQTWDDLVLPQEQIDAISELIARVRARRRVFEQWGFAGKVGKGLGTTALFSGPPGTGKTMVAALIARDLGLELYQVDLGKVVSKWIGETEKNLAAVFDAAESGHAILLFDEADALFGKRTDVKSSNDRHANLETNYLLQRLETFTGTCLLTSNHESHIDRAFQRRLSLHVRFDLPGVAERVELWRAMLPPAAPVAPNVDFEGLARRYAMSGGYIRNATLRAAFVAADEDVAISTAHLEHAARLEYEGMGKLVT